MVAARVASAPGRLIPLDPAVRHLLVPAVGGGAVGGVAESFVEGAVPCLVLLVAQLSSVAPASADAVLQRADQQGADAASLQNRVHGQLPQLARVGERDEVNPAYLDRDSKWGADRKIVDLTALGPLQFTGHRSPRRPFATRFLLWSFFWGSSP